MSQQDLLNARTNSPSQEESTTDVTLGDHTVAVPRDGTFDRYRVHTDLDDVAQDPRVETVDFFRHQPKTDVDSRIGPTATPNFYYAMSSARLTMAAPASALRSRLPDPLTPLEIAPGLGLASLMLSGTTWRTSTSTPKPPSALPFVLPDTADSERSIP